jgi:hypothetical protein
MKYPWLEAVIVLVLVVGALVMFWPSGGDALPDPEKWEIEAMYWDRGERVVIYRPKGDTVKLKWGPKHGP